MNLYPFQVEGRDALHANRRFLLADEMGLGKSAQVLAALDQGTLPAVVVCPASVRFVWADEVAKWRPELSVDVIASGKQAPAGADITVISYELFGRVRLRRPATLICDEAHYLQGRDTRRTRTVAGAAGKATDPDGLRVWLLTGTPIWSRPRSLFPLLVVLGLWRGTYWEFAREFCGATMANGWDDTEATNLAGLRALLAPALLRRLKADVLDQLPDKVRQVVKVAGRLSDAEIEVGPFDPSNVRGGWIPPGPIATAIRETAMARLPETLAHLRLLLETEDKLVVFAWNRDVLDGLAAGLDSYGLVRLDGATPLDARAAAVHDFQNGRPRVFLGQTVAAGTGVTLTAARVAVFAQPDWTPANLLQAEDRVHRIGQRDAVLVQYLVTRGSIEERMLASVLKKARIAGEIVAPNQGE